MLKQEIRVDYNDCLNPCQLDWHCLVMFYVNLMLLITNYRRYHEGRRWIRSPIIASIVINTFNSTSY